MHIMVPVKQTVDYTVKIRVRPDGTGVDSDKVKKSINPFDLIALEEAVLQKEKGFVTEITAVTIGPQPTKEALIQALAQGADSAIFILSEDNDDIDRPLLKAKALKSLCLLKKIDAVFMGKQAIDGDHNQVGQMLAGILGWSQATFVSKLDIVEDGFSVARETDSGLQYLSSKWPAIITTDLRLNTPRIPNLPAIMRAKKKTIENMIFSDLVKNEQNSHTELNIIKTQAPPKRKAGIKVSSVSEFVSALQERGVL